MDWRIFRKSNFAFGDDGIGDKSFCVFKDEKVLFLDDIVVDGGRDGVVRNVC